MSGNCLESRIICENAQKTVVRARGLEPPILSEPDPKSGASAIPPRARCEKVVLFRTETQARVRVWCEWGIGALVDSIGKTRNKERLILTEGEHSLTYESDEEITHDRGKAEAGDSEGRVAAVCAKRFRGDDDERSGASGRSLGAAALQTFSEQGSALPGDSKLQLQNDRSGGEEVDGVEAFDFDAGAPGLLFDAGAGPGASTGADRVGDAASIDGKEFSGGWRFCAVDLQEPV